MSTEIAIGSLERSVRTFAKSLEKLGLKTEVSVHRSGRVAYDLERSYVELEVTGLYLDRDSEELEASSTVRFLSGGYGSLTEDFGRRIGGTDGWRAMKAQGLTRIMGDLTAQGWVKP